jgi:hypothetical protein
MIHNTLALEKRQGNETLKSPYTKVYEASITEDEEI